MMKLVLATSPHLNHAAYQEGTVPLASDSRCPAQMFAPMGLLSLAGAIAEQTETEIADVNKAINEGRVPLSADFYRATADWLLESEPDLVGFMTEADSYHHVLRFCDALKSRKPEILIVLGGPHASAIHEETLRCFRAVDFVIRGEGEQALSALAQTLRTGGDIASVGSLTYRHNDAVKVNAALPLLADLDLLPWPDFALIQLEPEDAIYLEVGRGCPFRCNFCFTASYWQRRHRIKSAERVIAEMRYLKESYGREDFNLTHDMITTNRRWVLDFCGKLAQSELGVTWTCSSRTDTIDVEQIEAMQRAGCRNIYFGMESGTAEMQAKIEKDLDLAASYQIVREAVDAGIGVTVGFIAGLPEESADTLRGTLQEASRFLGLPASTVHLFGYSPYRGSPVFDQIKHRLVFDRHFVDFPLGRATHEFNCDLMERNFPLFTRYSWLDRYQDLSHADVRAAEEFFPIANAVKPLFLAIAMKYDPLTLLESWAEWIGARNVRRKAGAAGRYRGTIADFLQFLDEYVRGDSGEEFLREMIKWERMKNKLRQKPSLELTSDLANGCGVRTNPSADVAKFRYAPQFVESARSTSASNFAFYFKRDGSPAIVRLSALGVGAIELARRGIPVAALVEALASESGPGSGSQQARADRAAFRRSVVAETIEQLVETELIQVPERETSRS